MSQTTSLRSFNPSFTHLVHSWKIRHFALLHVASAVPPQHPSSGRVHREVAVVQTARPADGRHIPGAGAHDCHTVDLQCTCRADS